MIEPAKPTDCGNDDECTPEESVTEGETGSDTALAEAIRRSLLEQRISDLKTMLDDMRTQRDDMRAQRHAWQRQVESSQRALTDQREKFAPRSWWTAAFDRARHNASRDQARIS